MELKGGSSLNRTKKPGNERFFFILLNRNGYSSEKIEVFRNLNNRSTLEARDKYVGERYNYDEGCFQDGFTVVVGDDCE